MKKIIIHFGTDSEFENIIKDIGEFQTIGTIIKNISKEKIEIEGIQKNEETPTEFDNVIAYTDDYGGIKEWAILGAANNIFENPQIQINNLYLNNPPKKLYDNVKKAYGNIIEESYSDRTAMSIDVLTSIAKDYSQEIIGQPKVLEKMLPPLYSLTNQKRKKPVTLLFLGASGIGKTETAKFINSKFGGNMLRVQFSMQQTNDAYNYIFGADHGEDSFARELIRRETNVVLLDEFDKVNPLFYNAFYQMFDEGIFIDNNYCVNVEKCIFICTSNFMTEEEAEKSLGSPIYSRFSKVIKFTDISITDKIRIAKKCYLELFAQLENEDKKLIENNEILDFYISYINKGYYKNMRTLRNDIEDALYSEILKARGILA